MDRKVAGVLVAVLIAGLVAIFYPRRVADPPMAPLALPEQTSSTADRSPPFGPPPEPEDTPAFVAEEPPEALPALDESDAEARAVLADAAGSELVERHLAPNAVVRKLVATVDNLDGEAIWMRTRVVPRSQGQFLVEGDEEELFVASSNAGRYTAFVQLVEAIDTTQLAAAYQHHYPLLQQAYEELGYPGRQFHNRALAIIDHLLATPTVDHPIRLVQPHVLYKFADPELEALSSGQKALIRVGPGHSQTIRKKLIEFRAALESLSATPGSD